MNGRIESIPVGPSHSFPLARVLRISTPTQRPIEFIESFLDPAALIGSLWGLALVAEGQISNAYLLLGFVVFSMSFPGTSLLRTSWYRLVVRIALGWLTMATILFVFGYATRLIEFFDRAVLIDWLWLAPLSVLSTRAMLKWAAPWLVAAQANVRRVVIAGVNEQGLVLAQRIADDRLSDMRIVGFFDDRNRSRLPEAVSFPILGKLADLAGYAQTVGVDVIFLSLPMATQPRIMSLLDELRDTTASIYFVPDMFITDLIQGRMASVNGVPVVAVCESPFAGITGIIKRASDIVISLLILALALPLMTLIAIAIKLTSPGPVIFKQRRYGLDGREILVYKFRSMSVCEDGPVIAQAKRDDKRVTPLGAILRKTSLDELPQFINVLQGRMSIVGPRPHAVAHNELYRKLIKGYMVRHKVKPGITGWAQVSGLRGETETLDKMKARIDHDLDYLRNWSLRFDLYIIFRSIAIVLKDCRAY
jgi:putative colanic acid biosysnthesis UDP-glucose lipid carrier transferase